jgi:hypothetical protein
MRTLPSIWRDVGSPASMTVRSRWNILALA